MRSPIVPSLLVASALLCVAGPGAAQTKAPTLANWYFPEPWTFDSPLNPARDGGMDLAFTAGDIGWGMAFPFHTTLATSSMAFVTEMNLPLAIGSLKAGGGTKFYCGNPRLSLRGAWKFTMPFAEGFRLPAAWSVGLDIGIPLASLWSYNAAGTMGYLMHRHDPVAWGGHYMGLSPKAMFAIGKPLFYWESQLQFPFMINLDRSNYLLLWATGLGSQPIELLAISTEFGGSHLLNKSGVPADAADVYWWALGTRFYIGGLTTGLMFRLPFASGGLLDPGWSLHLTIGFERRKPQEF